MLTVIFGAGASFDSAPANSSMQAKDNPWRPPLTRDLFLPENIWFQTIKLPPRLIPVIERIRRDTKNNNLEFALEKLKGELDINPDRWEQMVAIQEWMANVLDSCTKQWLKGLSNATAYVDLLSRLNDWQIQTQQSVNIITFNYDNLLENAASICYKRQSGFLDFEEYLKADLQIFKPHGSINWWWDIPRDPDRKNLSDRPLSKNEIESAKLCIGSRREGTLTDGDKVYYSMPAIAIPVINKSYSDFVFPPKHREKMLSALDATSAILIIGWAGAEEHFMSEFSKRVKKDAPVMLVCGGDSPTMKNLQNLAGMRQIINTSSGFSDFLNTARLEDWLSNI